MLGVSASRGILRRSHRFSGNRYIGSQVGVYPDRFDCTKGLLFSALVDIDDLPTTRYYAPRWRALLLVLISVVPLAVVLPTINDVSFALGVLGAVGVACSCFFMYLGVPRLIRRRPELIITADGIEHFDQGRILWTDIDSIRLNRMHGQRILEFLLHQPDTYLAQLPWFVRTTSRFMRASGYSPATISALTLPVPLETVLEAMRRHRPSVVIA
ncbi:STM3941 family protein [Nocardia sp. R6R-6]|uniref:STM3941 family protein n=1 Tax=Nocardia sp. R6R-6 TaxID=3459303 RepID=UPI00403DC487